jgi:hypothetical protein
MRDGVLVPAIAQAERPTTRGREDRIFEQEIAEISKDAEREPARVHATAISLSTGGREDRIF